MADFLFLLFSFLTLGSAALVVVNRNAVNAAMFLLLSLVGLAGLFILLGAPLLAFVLLLVYAGAVVALFLFIVMLLDTRGTTRAFRRMSIAAALLGGALLTLGVASLADRARLPAPEAAEAALPALKDYAGQLFTTYLLPVQLVGFLLLIALLGVIVLSRPYTAPEDTP